MASLASSYETRRYLSSIWTDRASSLGFEREKAEQISPAEVSTDVAPRKIKLPSVNLRPVLFYPLSFLNQAIDWAFLAAIGLFLILFGLQFSHPLEWDRSWLILRLRELGNPALTQVAEWSRCEWPSPTVSCLPLGLALGTWMVKLAVSAVFLPILRPLRRKAPRQELTPEPILFLGEGQVAVSADSEQARELLLRRYREIEGALKSAKRKRCAFLSIDIADSTQMKEDEKELAITVTFRAYMEMLEEIFARYGVWKQAWTPDGVMVCFLQLELAVAAAQSLLHRLRKFNRSQNLLRTAIFARCGLNEGEVSIFDDSKLEKIAHRVIDVAGHMQKHANTNSLWLSAEIYESLANKSGFRPTDAEVDGCKVYEWSAVRSATASNPSLPAQQAWVSASGRG